jgi:hypothetical protein
MMNKGIIYSGLEQRNLYYDDLKYRKVKNNITIKISKLYRKCLK